MARQPIRTELVGYRYCPRSVFSSFVIYERKNTMRAVLTRVNSASVTIDGEVVGKIGKGFLILLGVGPNDTEKECRYLA